MDENQITGSVQYAFGPDGVLVTGPVLMDDPATGKIICACCRVPKSEHSFLTMGPYNFKSQFCLDCERVSFSCSQRHLESVLTVKASTGAASTLDIGQARFGY